MATRAKNGRRSRTRANSDIELTAKLLRGFADPKRLAILLELSDGEKRVTDLIAAVGSSQGNVLMLKVKSLGVRSAHNWEFFSLGGK